MRVMGFMSGTSLDGVDVAIIETDGRDDVVQGATGFAAFSDGERAILARATRDALAWNGYGDQPAILAGAAGVIEAAHVLAGRDLLSRCGPVDLIGFHGQTVLHRPERGLTVQIGDPQVIADGLGVPVVAQMRQDDLQAGGQGAPLVPAYHAALARSLGCPGPVAFLNIGGVANLTWIGRDGALVAFDTGPGNGLIDEVVQARGVGRYDDGGRLARAGQVDQERLAKLLEHPYFRGRGARSLDRYDFALDWAEGRKLEDVVATLTAFTAEAVGLALDHLPEAPDIWVLCGGGAHNPAMVDALRERLGACRLASDLGLRGDYIEAEAMAYLAARSLAGLPLTWPETTGVRTASTGGRLWQPAGVAHTLG